MSFQACFCSVTHSNVCKFFEQDFQRLFALFWNADDQFAVASRKKQRNKERRTAYQDNYFTGFFWEENASALCFMILSALWKFIPVDLKISFYKNYCLLKTSVSWALWKALQHKGEKWQDSSVALFWPLMSICSASSVFNGRYTTFLIRKTETFV